MRYRIEISEKAREQLRTRSKEMRRNIGQRMEAMRDDLRRGVLKLREKGNRYRFVWAPFVFCSFWQVMRFRFMLSRTENKLMSEAAILEKIETLNQAVARL